jgi:3-hydroxymyristoyl/3-hydroxydecanoyl-(acyl carrier protein) dehydratase
MIETPSEAVSHPVQPFRHQWRLGEACADTKGAVRARAEITADSSWFDGHFPGSPILPGIAQVALIETLLRQVLDPALVITELRRVRFRQAIGPGAELRLTATPQAQPGRYLFKIELGGDLAASGLLCVARAVQVPALTQPIG